MPDSDKYPDDNFPDDDDFPDYSGHIDNPDYPDRTPIPAAPQLIRRIFIDAIGDVDPSHSLESCDCLPCTRVRRILDLIGLTLRSHREYWMEFDRKDDDSKIDPLLVTILVHEIIGLKVGRPPLEGMLEVPVEVADVLWHDGWGPILLAAESHTSSGRRHDEQLAWIRGARRQFIEEYAKAALSDSVLAQIDVSDWPALGGVIDDQHAEAALAAHTERFARMGISSPQAPTPVLPFLRLERNGTAITTAGVDIGAKAGYRLENLVGPYRVLADYIRPDRPGHFVVSGGGNEYSTMWGWTARGGKLFASVQMTTWRFSADSSSDWAESIKARASRLVDDYNELLVPIMNERGRNVDVAVVFSDYRKDSFVFAEGAWPYGAPNPRMQLPAMWGCVLDLSDVARDDVEEIDRRVAAAIDRAPNRPEVMTAIEFLRRAHPV